MFKDRDSDGGKLNEGPIWNHNLSFGKTWYKKDDYCADEWETDHNHHKPNDWLKVPSRREKLGHDRAFARRVEAMWRELSNGILQLDNVYVEIDQLVDTIAEAGDRNFERWPETANKHSYETDIEMMKQWLSNRVDWIKTHLSMLSTVQHWMTSEEFRKALLLTRIIPIRLIQQQR
jgi:hypothetical protein